MEQIWAAVRSRHAPSAGEPDAKLSPLKVAPGGDVREAQWGAGLPVQPPLPKMPHSSVAYDPVSATDVRIWCEATLSLSQTPPLSALSTKGLPQQPSP